MTTAEVETPKRRAAATRPEAAGSLSGELLDAGAAVAERTLRLARTTADSGLRVTDTFVLGALGATEEWASSTPFAALALPPVKVARETWGSTRDGLREFVAGV